MKVIIDGHKNYNQLSDDERKMVDELFQTMFVKGREDYNFTLPVNDVAEVIIESIAYAVRYKKGEVK